MREDFSVRILYGNPIGRSILKLLINPQISKVAGDFLDSKISTFLIKGFQKKNNISLDEIEIPEDGFKSFNSFFSRKRKKNYYENIKKKLQERNSKEQLQGNYTDKLLSPCDAFLSVIPIKEGVLFDIKHTWFTLEDLLVDRKLAEEFAEGYALVFRLTPAHYHRYCYGVDGVMKAKRIIPGKLHCVRPIATRQYPVFAQNAREYQVIETETFGKIVQMEIGALLVGRIANHNISVGDSVAVLQEKGYFEYGGSTIVMLVKKDQLKMKGYLKNMRIDTGEMSVKQGMVIASAMKSCNE